jgi:hypothetical protein
MEGVIPRQIVDVSKWISSGNVILFRVHKDVELRACTMLVIILNRLMIAEFLTIRVRRKHNDKLAGAVKNRIHVAEIYGILAKMIYNIE